MFTLALPQTEAPGFPCSTLTLLLMFKFWLLRKQTAACLVMRNKYCLGSVVLLGILWLQQHKVWTSKLSVIVLYSLLRHIGNSCPTVIEWDSQFRHGLLAFTVSFAFLDISGSMDKLSKRAVGSKKAINNHSLPGWPPTEVWRHYIRLFKKAEVFFTVTADLPAETRTC